MISNNQPTFCFIKRYDLSLEYIRALFTYFLCYIMYAQLYVYFHLVELSNVYKRILIINLTLTKGIYACGILLYLTMHDF